MKCKLSIICGPDLVNGFQLAGADAQVVNSPEEARDLLATKLNAGAWEVTLVAEDIAAMLPERLKKRLFESLMPLFVPLPMHPNVSEDGVKEHVSRLIQNAIGKKIAV